MIRNNNKGFTLIELMAVIILISIITILIMTKVNPAIKESKESTYYAATENLIDALEEYYFNQQMIGNFSGCTYTFSIDINECVDFSFSGKKPDDGSLTLDSEGAINGKVSFDGVGYRVVNGKVLDSNGLPKDYVRLDYIKSNGYQYINLGYKAKTNTEIMLDIAFENNAYTTESSADDGSNHILGCDTLDDGVFRFSINFGSGNTEYKTIFYWTDVSYSRGGTIYNYTYSSVLPRSMMTVKSGMAKYQGVTINIASKAYDNMDNMVLLGSFDEANNAINSFKRYNAFIYGMEIYEDDQLIMDLVPVYVKQYDVSGLYDMVNGNFYRSDGPEQFLKGELN